MRTTLAILTIVLAEAAFAQALPQQLLLLLESQGFQVSDVRRTWLGRTLVISINEETGAIREIVLDKGSGQIMNDAIFEPGSNIESDNSVDNGSDEATSEQSPGGDPDKPDKDKPGPDRGGPGRDKGGAGKPGR